MQEHCIPLYLQAASSVSQVEPLSASSALFPNPLTSSSFIALTPEQAAKKFEVKIFDSEGRNATNNFNINIFSDSVTIERRNAPSGMYYYRLVDKVSFQPSSIIGAGHFIVQ
jgi:hypothetical protein